MAPEPSLRLLGGCRDDPQSERLGQNQYVAHASTRVGNDGPGIDTPDDGQSEDRLLGLDRVAAHDGYSRLVCLLDRATENFAEHFGRQGPAREADQAERRQGNAGHGIDVAQGIGRRDRAEVIRAVDDRREKIGGEDQRQFVAESINSRVIGRCVTDDHVGIGDARQCREQREQVVRRLLGGTTGSLGKLGEVNGVEINHRIACPGFCIAV